MKDGSANTNTVVMPGKKYMHNINDTIHIRAQYPVTSEHHDIARSTNSRSIWSLELPTYRLQWPASYHKATAAGRSGCNSAPFSRKCKICKTNTDPNPTSNV